MNDKIKKMRGFLMACHMTSYLLPEQIALLTMGLDILETAILFAEADLTEILEQKTAELKGVSI